MGKNYLETKTKENNRVFFRKEQVCAIEEIPGSSRTEPYIKVFTAGYSFNLSETMDEFMAALESDSNGDN